MEKHECQFCRSLGISIEAVEHCFKKGFDVKIESRYTILTKRTSDDMFSGEFGGAKSFPLRFCPECGKRIEHPTEFRDGEPATTKGDDGP